jgi:hypothetical protein
MSPWSCPRCLLHDRPLTDNGTAGEPSRSNPTLEAMDKRNGSNYGGKSVSALNAMKHGIFSVQWRNERRRVHQLLRECRERGSECVNPASENSGVDRSACAKIRQPSDR